VANYVQDTIDGSIHRMLSDGVLYRDLMQLRGSIGDPDAWCDAWMSAASTHEDVGRRALLCGARLTAGEALWRAALYCHFAQGYFTDNFPDKKLTAEKRKQSLFREAAPLLRPPLARVEIPFRGDVAPGYLRLPAGVANPACVVLFGGLDSTKEDSLTLSDLLVDRGVASLAFDGPGQGEMFYRMMLIPDFESVVSSAIDFLEKRPDVDAARIGIVGRSTGGHWACQTAAKDTRVKAAIAWGLAYHVRNMPQMPQTVQNRWLRAGGLKTVADAMAYFKAYDLDGVASQISCPLMVVQGGRDPIVPAEGVDLLKRQVKGPLEVLTWPDSGHCCHERYYITKPAMADFMARHLQNKSNK
jgi:2,6-dihydroxypseudooxynicotine hydrolase